VFLAGHNGTMVNYYVTELPATCSQGPDGIFFDSTILSSLTDTQWYNDPSKYTSCKLFSTVRNKGQILPDKYRARDNKLSPLILQVCGLHSSRVLPDSKSQTKTSPSCDPGKNN